jgi:hypothetical protein
VHPPAFTEGEKPPALTMEDEIPWQLDDILHLTAKLAHSSTHLLE